MGCWRRSRRARRMRRRGRCWRSCANRDIARVRLLRMWASLCVLISSMPVQLQRPGSVTLSSATRLVAVCPWCPVSNHTILRAMAWITALFHDQIWTVLIAEFHRFTRLYMACCHLGTRSTCCCARCPAAAHLSPAARLRACTPLTKVGAV